MNPPNKSMKHDKKGVNYSTKGKYNRQNEMRAV